MANQDLQKEYHTDTDQTGLLTGHFLLMMLDPEYQDLDHLADTKMKTPGPQSFPEKNLETADLEVTVEDPTNHHLLLSDHHLQIS